MEKQNITLAIPRKLLKRAKLLAVRRDTSVSQLMTELLEDLVDREDSYERARRAGLALLDRRVPMGTGGSSGWSREDLHRR